MVRIFLLSTTNLTGITSSNETMQLKKNTVPTKQVQTYQKHFSNKLFATSVLLINCQVTKNESEKEKLLSTRCFGTFLARQSPSSEYFRIRFVRFISIYWSWVIYMTKRSFLLVRRLSITYLSVRVDCGPLIGFSWSVFVNRSPKKKNPGLGLF